MQFDDGTCFHWEPHGEYVFDLASPDPATLISKASRTIDVEHIDCKGVEAIARRLKIAAEFFATPHGVPGIKTFYLQSREVDGPLPLFDARRVDVADLLKLRKRKARMAAYLGAGATSIDNTRTPVPRCIQKLCVPEPEALCAARDESVK